MARSRIDRATLHLRRMIEDGQEIPRATSPTEIVIAPAMTEVGRLLVRGEI